MDSEFQNGCRMSLQTHCQNHNNGPFNNLMEVYETIFEKRTNNTADLFRNFNRAEREAEQRHTGTGTAAASLDHDGITLGEDLVEIMAGIPFNHGDQKLMDAIDNEESHESIQKIINDGAGVLARDIKGLSLSQLAPMGGTAHAVETLLSNDANFDDRGGYTWKHTALMLAAEGGQDRHLTTVKILLSSNADTTLKNTFKQTALDIARACKCPESEQCKHSASADVLSLSEYG